MFDPIINCLFTLLSLCVLFVPTVYSEVLPSRTVYEHNWPPQSIPETMLSAGSQPAVQSLLANEPNCSRWIWGSCYFEEGGRCGEGRQHATRSGLGCRIIGITSRCFIECKSAVYSYDHNKQKVNGNVWGVDENQYNKNDENGNSKSSADLYNSFNTDNNDNDHMWATEDNRDKTGFYADEEDSRLVGLDKGGSDTLSSEDGDHCRWYKASWSDCNDQGYRTREKKLRVNRKEKEGWPCPSIKRETKACGSPIEEAAAPVTSKPVAKLDAPCKWDHAVKKCDNCNKITKKQYCTNPLLSGNPKTCGEERKQEQDCK